MSNLCNNTAGAVTVDPLSGRGCLGERRSYDATHLGLGRLELPVTMWTSGDDPSLCRDRASLERARCRHDFQFWAARCCRIHDKSTGQLIPFVLNAPQRRVAALLEGQRLEGRPLRLIMLKARQWGGSTLVQMYMAWIQCTQRTNWNSLICAHVKDTAATIRGMYSRMLASYPRELWDAEGADDAGAAEGRVPAVQPEFRPYERSINVREIVGRGCRVTLGSAENHEAVRGADYAMAHLSEVAFWPSSTQRSPAQFVQAVCGAINTAPLTLIVMESTANGIGNYFHTEWLRAEAGMSDKVPVFVPWYEIEIYRRPLDVAPGELIASLDAYEKKIYEEHHLTPEQINWYRHKRREYQSLMTMQAEYPTTAAEAFATSGASVFGASNVERLRPGCVTPPWRGDMCGSPMWGAASLDALKPVEGAGGALAVWERPVGGKWGVNPTRYLVTVDIGGRSERSDYSVIAVFDRMSPTAGCTLEVVAQWRGHIDHDLLAWKAAALARWYGDAVLVFESNTLESDSRDGDPSHFILETLARHYPSLWRRRDPLTGTRRPGFHTNRATKTEAIDRLIIALRENTLIERDSAALGELLTYEMLPSGTMAARAGCHDDMLMTRAIALAVNAHLPPPDPTWHPWSLR